MGPNGDRRAGASWERLAGGSIRLGPKYARHGRRSTFAPWPKSAQLVAWVVLTLEPRRLRGQSRRRCGTWSDRLRLCWVGFRPNSGRINFGVGSVRLGRNERGRSVSVLTMTLLGSVQRRRGRGTVASTHGQAW